MLGLSKRILYGGGGESCLNQYISTVGKNSAIGRSPHLRCRSDTQKRLEERV